VCYGFDRRCCVSVTFRYRREVSVLPMDLFLSFNRLLEDAVSSRTVAAFGNGAVQLFGPVQLTITLCGVSVEHPFYLVDDKAASLSPALGGYDLMKAAHLVMDIPNGLAWSRLTQPLLEPQTPSPNPSTVELPHTHFNSSVLLVEGSDPSLVSVAEEGRDCSVCEDVAVPTSFVESVSLPSESVVADRSSVLSHQVSVVLPPLLYGRSPPFTLVWTLVSLRSSPGRAPAAGWNPLLLSPWMDRLSPH